MDTLPTGYSTYSIPGRNTETSFLRGTRSRGRNRVMPGEYGGVPRTAGPCDKAAAR